VALKFTSGQLCVEIMPALILRSLITFSELQALHKEIRMCYFPPRLHMCFILLVGIHRL